jgi:hypothetical protein
MPRTVPTFVEFQIGMTVGMGFSGQRPPLLAA